MKIVIVDIDGTLSNCEHRLKNINGNTQKDWDEFFKAASTDPAYPEMIDLVDQLFAEYQIIFMTGRPEKFRKMTETWLKKYLGDSVTQRSILVMRPDGDFRTDDIIKFEQFYDLGLEKDDIAFVIEDRARVVKMWRGIGLRCLQVAEGNF